MIDIINDMYYVDCCFNSRNASGYVYSPRSAVPTSIILIPISLLETMCMDMCTSHYTWFRACDKLCVCTNTSGPGEDVCDSDDMGVTN
jgi:hypothetical protein